MDANKTVDPVCTCGAGNMFWAHLHRSWCPCASNPDMQVILTGTELIAEERERQISKEGWTCKHDDTHVRGELAVTAACYAAHTTDMRVVNENGDDAWPFDCCDDKRKKHTRLRQLVIAGALIAAEIDRLQRVVP